MRRPISSISQLIDGSLPPIDAATLPPPQRALLDSLPPDYRSFLDAHNGGRVPDFAVAFDTGVPFKSAEVDNPSHNDGVREFFGLRSPGADCGPADLLQCRVTHDEEEFLPSGMVAVAICASSSLVCLSLRPRDFGVVFYWDWYWRYPWCKWFFEERVAAVSREHPGARAILDDPSHPRHRELVDAFNHATVVRLAPSFDAWLAACYDAREESTDQPTSG